MIISGIVGYPLKKPRSIIIWRKYFRKNNISSKMLKFEITPKNNYLDKIDKFAKKAGSVNLILKKKEKLMGYNTDLYGAIDSIKQQIFKNKIIMIIGLGGTGQALFNYLSKTYSTKKFILISKSYKKRRRNIVILKSLNKKILSKKALIINCTPLGSDLKKKFKKQIPIDRNLIKNINSSSFIFDIIYSPRNTLLSNECKKYSLNYMNGLNMNTLQAERALKIAFKK